MGRRGWGVSVAVIAVLLLAVACPASPSRPPARVEGLEVSSLLECSLRNCEFRGVAVSGVVMVDEPGSYGLALYYSRGEGWKPACWLAEFNSPGRHSFYSTCEIPVDAESLGHALFRGGEWLQSIDIHGLNVSAVMSGVACILVLRPPEIEDVEAPPKTSISQDVRFSVWVSSGVWPISVELDVGELKLSKRVKVQGLEPCNHYVVRVDFGPIHFSEPGEYKWRVVARADGYVDSRSGSLEVKAGEENKVVVVKRIKGLGIVSVEAPRVMKPGREYEFTYRVDINWEEVERLLWILGEICKLLCSLPQTRPYMPSAMCKACGAEKLYLGVHGGLRAYLLLPDGHPGLAVFISLGLQQVQYSLPLSPHTHLVGSQVSELISLHYVITGVPPLSLEDLESKGAPYSLKVTPLTTAPTDLTRVEGGAVVLRYRVELVPSEEYAGVLPLYEARAVYNGTHYTEDLLSDAEAMLEALQAVSGANCEELQQRVSQLGGELEECKSRLEELINETRKCCGELSECMMKLEKQANTLAELKGKVARLSSTLSYTIPVAVLHKNFY